MGLVFVGIDPETKGEDCPAAWVDVQELRFVLQGWKAGEAIRQETQLRSPLPETEDVILMPARMLPVLRAACDQMERAMAGRSENDSGAGRVDLVR
jgi:hypothetical protein